MKERTPEQLKGQIRSFAGKRNLQSQEVLQMFLLERVLDRLSKSKYKKPSFLRSAFSILSVYFPKIKVPNENGISGRLSSVSFSKITPVFVRIALSPFLRQTAAPH